MTQGADGVWTLTTAPLQPELYGYGFRADGIAYLDPGSVLVKPNLLNIQNEIEVPGPQPMDWDMQNVPARRRPSPLLPIADARAAERLLRLHAAGLQP